MNVCVNLLETHLFSYDFLLIGPALVILNLVFSVDSSFLYYTKIPYIYLELLYQCYYCNNQTCNITKTSSNVLGKIDFL